MGAREAFAKMSGSLDSNRKIREAGRNGREVYLWVLRQIALRDSDGEIPLEDVQAYRYLGEQLMCSADEAREGFERACAAGLLAVTEVTDDRYAQCVVVGWDEDWGRRPLSNAERQARHRAKHNSRATLQGLAPVASNGAFVTSNGAVTRNAGEERRGEEKREGRVTENATTPLQLAPPDGKRPRKPREKQPRTPQPPDFAPKESHREKAARLGLDLADEFIRFTNSNAKRGSQWASWDHALHDWLDRAPEFNRGRAGPFPAGTANHATPRFTPITAEDL